MRLLFAHVCLLLLLGMGTSCFCEDSLTSSDLRAATIPILGSSRPRSFSSRLSRENDTNPALPGQDSGNLSSFSIYMYPRTLTLYPHDEAWSPFEFGAIVLAALFNILGILNPTSLFHSSRFQMLTCAIAVLPICAHQQASLLKTHVCATLSRFKSFFRCQIKL